MATSLDPQIITRLDRIIELLEQQNKTYRPPVPEIPALPAPGPIAERPACPKCGIKLDKIMGYVCNVSQCPTGLGPLIS